jgi:tetratricopeptide (TPR) repeat protein
MANGIFPEITSILHRRSANDLIGIMFEPRDSIPTLRPGFRTESEYWDFKRDCPTLSKESENAWASFARDLLGFFNKDGGALILGINEEGGYGFCGCNTVLDSKIVNDKVRKYVGDTVWVQFNREFIQKDQRYLGIAIVDRRGPNFIRFQSDAPTINGKRLFARGDIALRSGDSTRIYKGSEADALASSIGVPTIGKVYNVDEPFFRILQPDYEEFLYRETICPKILKSLKDPRTAISSLTGIGGAGKTSLATWAVMEAYHQGQFKFIVSVTAKDRELTTTGIRALSLRLSSFEELLDSVLVVLNFPDYKSESTEKKEKCVRDLLYKSDGLLYVDNLETIDDERIIRFLDDLPEGCRAITTSRRTKVKVSVYPIEIPPLLDSEATRFIQLLSRSEGFHYLENLSSQERLRLGRAANGIPIAIKWLSSQANGTMEILSRAEKLEMSTKQGEELLEFCFRRVFDSLENNERDILQVLSMFKRPLPQEALLVATKLPSYKISDATDILLRDSLIQRLFDPELNDYSYTLLPIVQSFVYSQLRQDHTKEQVYREQLTQYYEALDIPDAEQRIVMREIRQGHDSAEGPLIDLAKAASKRGDLSTAEQLFKQALERSPNSWRAAIEYAEYLRHITQDVGEALKFYERAAVNSPSRGPERAMIFREYGMILKDSGEQSATDAAIQKLEVAHEASPNDPVIHNALAGLFVRKGQYRIALNYVEPLANHKNQKIRENARKALRQCYAATNDSLKVTKLNRARLSEELSL